MFNFYHTLLLTSLDLFFTKSNKTTLFCTNLTRFRTTVVAADGFFDTFQRIADVALSSRGRIEATRQFVFFWFFFLSFHWR